MFYKCYNNRNISIKGDYIMSIKLVKASNEYQDLIVDMLKEWIDYNNNHPEANTSPASIFKNDYHNFDYYINNLDLKSPEYIKLENESKKKDEKIKNYESLISDIDSRLRRIEEIDNFTENDFNELLE